MGYLKNTIKGFSWVGAFRLASRLVSFLRTIILARLLLPFDFGLFGIVSLVLAFLDILTEVGVTFVLVREKDWDQDFINTAWSISIIRGFFGALVIFGTARFLGFFFHTPQVTPLLFLSGFVPLIRGFINPAESKFQKDLLFEKEFQLKFSVFVFDSLISVILVVLSRSAQGLVCGLIAGAILELILSFVMVKPIPQLTLNPRYFRKIIAQGKWITALGVLNYFFTQGDNLVVGKFLNSQALGLYQMAYKIAILPITEIADVVARVTFPVYTKIVEDKARIKKAFWKTTLGISLLTVPVGLVLFFYSRTIVEILLGKTWLDAVPVLRILSIFGVIKAISSPTLTLFLSMGKQKFVTIITLVSLVFLAVTIFPLTFKLGILGTGFAVLLASVLQLPILFFYLTQTFSQKKL